MTDSPEYPPVTNYMLGFMYGNNFRQSNESLEAPKTRKVKELSPSPFYDGKYHPPIISSTRATLVTNWYRKVTDFPEYSQLFLPNLSTGQTSTRPLPPICRRRPPSRQRREPIRADAPFWSAALPPSPCTFRPEHSNLRGRRRHIAALHENPDIRCIYWERYNRCPR